MDGDLLDLIPLGVMLVSAGGVIKNTNRVARQVLARQDTFKSVNGQLGFVCPDLTKSFSGFRQSPDVKQMLMRVPHSAAEHEQQLFLARKLHPSGDVLVTMLAGTESNHLSESMVADALGLTQAEARVALCAVNQQRVPDIAKELGISPHTVRAHLKHIFRKLQINSRKELTVIMIRMAMLTTGSNHPISKEGYNDAHHGIAGRT